MYNELWVFRSYDNFCTQQRDPHERPLNPGRGTKFAAWKVARAATAAWLYFKPLEIALDDGEVIRRPPRRLSRTLTGDLSRQGSAFEANNRTRRTALLSDAGFSRVNNPSMKVLAELRSIFRNGPKEIANWVSIGTGRQTSPHGISKLKSVLRKAVTEIGDPEAEHEQMEQLHPRTFDYYRLNEPNGLPHMEMDDWKPRRSPNAGTETIQAMKAAVDRWVANHHEDLRRAAESLVDIRRARTKDDSMWERFALGRQYICPAPDCYLDPDETWHYKDSFIRHLVDDHEYEEDSDELQTAVRRSSRDWEYKSPDTYSTL